MSNVLTHPKLAIGTERQVDRCIDRIKAHQTALLADLEPVIDMLKRLDRRLSHRELQGLVTDGERLVSEILAIDPLEEGNLAKLDAIAIRARLLRDDLRLFAGQLGVRLVEERAS